MVIIILKTSCTAPSPQPPISDNTLSSSSLSFDYNSSHHSNIQCDVSFLSTNNDNNFIVLRQSFRPCGIDNVLLLTRRHNYNDDASRRFKDDNGFSISLTNCQFNRYHDIDVSPSTVRLTNMNYNNDKWIGSVQFDLSSVVNDDDGIGGECRAANFTSTANNNTTSHHSHYYNDKNQLLQSIDNQMKQLQMVFAALGIFGLVLIVGFVYTARCNSRKLTLSSSKKIKCERVKHDVNEGVDDNAMVSTEAIRSSKRKQTSDEIVIVESSSSVHHSTVNESTSSFIAPSSRDDFNGCGGRNESCHETLHLISCQRENDKGEEEESSSSSPRQWYDDLLSPRPTAAAAAVTASGDTGMPLRTLFSNASSAKNGDDNVKNVPGGQVLSKDRDSSQVDMLVPVESSMQQLTSNSDDTANCQGGECNTISAVVLDTEGECNTSTIVVDTEKDYDRVENDKASEGWQFHNNSRDPQDRLSVNADFPAADFKQQTMSITKNQQDTIVMNCQEGQSTAAAAAAAALLQGQTLLQDKSSQTNDCNIRIDCEELTPVTKNKHDSIVTTSRYYRQEASSIVKSPFSPVSKTTNINFLELVERIEASENDDVIIADEETMSTPLLPRRSGCDVRVVSPDDENGIKSAVLADDDEPIDDTVAVVDHCHDIICETDSKIPASVVIHPDENITSLIDDKNLDPIVSLKDGMAHDCGNTEMIARNLASAGANDVQVRDDACQPTPKTTNDKCEDESNEIHSNDDSTSSSASLLVSLNSNDAPGTKHDYSVHDASSETVSGLPKEITSGSNTNSMIPISDDRSIVNSMSPGSFSASLLVSADGDVISPKEGNDNTSIGDSLSSASLLVSVDGNASIKSGNEGADVKSIADSLSSASLLVSDDDDADGLKECNENKSIADSISSVSLLVSLDGDAKDECIRDVAAYDGAMQKDMTESKDATTSVDHLRSNNPSDDSSNESIKVETNDISAHNMKHNVIQELKSSSRFKFKQSGANAVSSFADELAVVTGKKALAESNDFASSLAKCVAEKEHCKTPKKAGRKVLMPLHASPRPKSADTRDSEFLSDYW